MSLVVGLSNNSYKPITNTRGFAPGFVNYKKGALDSQPIKFTSCFPGTPASTTTKTGSHDIAEILLKVALNTINQIKLNPILNKNEIKN
jgi:hypothetical protein